MFKLPTTRSSSTVTITSSNENNSKHSGPGAIESVIWEGRTPHLRIIQITSIEPGSTTVQVTLSISNLGSLTNITDFTSGSEITNLFYDRTVLCRQDPYGDLIPGLRPAKTSQFIRYQPPLNIPNTPTSETVMKNQKFIKSEEIKYQHPYCPTISMTNSVGLLNPVNAIAMYTTSSNARASVRMSLQLSDTSTWRSDGLSDPSFLKGGQIYGKAFDAITTTPTKNSAMLNYASLSTRGAEANASSEILYCTILPRCRGLVVSQELIGLNFHVPSLASGSTTVMRLAYTFSTIATQNINRIQETKETLALQANAFTFTADFLSGDDPSVYVLIRPLLWAVSPSVGDAGRGEEEDASCLAVPQLLKTSLYCFFNGGEGSESTWFLESTTSKAILTLTSSAAGLTDANGKRCGGTLDEDSDRVFLFALPLNVTRYKILPIETALHCRVMFSFLLPDDIGISFVSSSLYSKRNLELNRQEVLVDTTATIATALNTQSISIIVRNCGPSTSNTLINFYSTGCSISFTLTEASMQLIGVNTTRDSSLGLVSLHLHREILTAGTVDSALLAVYSPANQVSNEEQAPFSVELNLGNLTDGMLVLLRATSRWSDQGQSRSTLVGVVSTAYDRPTGRPSRVPHVWPSGKPPEKPTSQFPDRFPSIQSSIPPSSFLYLPTTQYFSHVPSIVATHLSDGAPASFPPSDGSHQGLVAPTNVFESPRPTAFYPLLTLLALPLMWAGLWYRGRLSCGGKVLKTRRIGDPGTLPQFGTCDTYIGTINASADDLEKSVCQRSCQQRFQLPTPAIVSDIQPEHRPASPQFPTPATSQPQPRALTRISTDIRRNPDGVKCQKRQPIKRPLPVHSVGYVAMSQTASRDRIFRPSTDSTALAGQVYSSLRQVNPKALHPLAIRKKKTSENPPEADEAFSRNKHSSLPALSAKARIGRDMSIHVPAMIFSEHDNRSSTMVYRALHHVQRPSISGRNHLLFQVDQAVIRRKNLEENV